MTLSAILRRMLSVDPEGENISLDDLETTVRHGNMIRGKPFLRRIYLDHYLFFRRQAQKSPPQVRGWKLAAALGLSKT
jgi:hypothetical protein